MKRMTSRALSIAMAMSMGGAAMAQDRSHDFRPGPPPSARSSERFMEHPGEHHEGPDAHRYGAGPDHAFYKGERLPPRFRTHHYVVDNWRAHHLRAPLKGYHWVQSGGDYLMVAIGTGYILDIVVSR